ncbi:MAG TPA: hypothetical protein VK652_01815 [Steroidobacteraceae bacterium]|nr:hypothetical protein [Steroidobacteraceae bacterium]
MQSSPREIISLWKSVNALAHVEAFASDIGVKTLTAHAWIRRGKIPSKHWRRIIEAANTRGFPVTWMNLEGTAELVQQGEAA